MAIGEGSLGGWGANGYVGLTAAGQSIERLEISKEKLDNFEHEPASAVNIFVWSHSQPALPWLPIYPCNPPKVYTLKDRISILWKCMVTAAALQRMIQMLVIRRHRSVTYVPVESKSFLGSYAVLLS